MIKKINKLITLIALAFSFCFISFSCVMAIDPINIEDGKLAINLPSISEIRSVTNVPADSLELLVSVKAQSGTYTHEKQYTAGSNFTLDKLDEGNYEITVSGQDEKFTYYSEKVTVDVKKGKTTDVKIKVLYKLKGGQISLVFKNCNFDSNSTFNVLVKDKKDKELFSKLNIPVNEIINSKYTLDYYFPESSYFVYVTGGNSDSEVYYVSDNKEIPVISESISEALVEPHAYKTFYVSGKNNGTSEGFGSEANPYSLEVALEKINILKEPAKIIVLDEIHLSKPLNLSNGVTISFDGRHTGKIIGDSSEVFNISSANVLLKDIELLSSNGSSLNTVIFNEGNLTLDRDVFIQSIYIASGNKVQINKPLNKSKQMTISLPNRDYVEGNKVISFLMESDFESSSIKLANPNYELDGKGFIRPVLKDYMVSLINNETSSTGYSNKGFQYKVMLDSEEVIPSTPVTGDTNFVLPGLKAGNTYTVTVNSKYTNSNDLIALTGNSEAYINKWCFNIEVNAENDKLNKTLFDLKLNSPSRTTGSIKVQALSGNIERYPLTVQLKGLNNNITTTIHSIPSYINYLPVDNYSVTISGESLEEGYSVNNVINVNLKNVATCDFEIVPKAVFYVENKVDSANKGTINNPFTSINEALNHVALLTTPITLVVAQDIVENTQCTISDPINLTIIGENIVGAERPRSAKITANTGLFILDNANANITFKNIEIVSNSQTPITLRDGTITLDNNSVLTSSAAEIPLINVNNTAHFNVKDSVNTNSGYISLGDGALINALNSLKGSNIQVKLDNAKNAKKIIEFDNNLIPDLSLIFTYVVGDDFVIRPDGTIMKSDFRPLDEVLKTDLIAGSSVTKTVNVYVDNLNEFKMLGNALRSLNRTSRITLNLAVNESITNITSDIFNPYLNGLDTLASITIPKEIVSISENAFSYCENLKEIIFADNKGTWYSFLDSITFNPSANPANNARMLAGYGESPLWAKVINLADITKLLSNEESRETKYLVANITSSEIPELTRLIKNYKGGNVELDLFITKIEELPSNAFSNCLNLTKIIFPRSLNTIGANAFLGCNNLSHAQFTEVSSWNINSELFTPYYSKVGYSKNAEKLRTSNTSWMNTNELALYVDSSNGNNEYSGNATSPLATVSKAIQVAESNPALNINSVVKIFVSGIIEETSEIKIGRAYRLFISGKTSDATIKAVNGGRNPDLPLNVSDHRVMKIGYSSGNFPVTPIVTLENIKITGGFDSRGKDGPVGSGIFVDAGALILGNGTVVDGNEIPSNLLPPDQSNDMQNSGIFISDLADGVLLKGNATVGSRDDTKNDYIYLSRYTVRDIDSEKPSSHLFELDIDNSFTGYATVTGEFEPNEQVISSKFSNFNVFTPNNFVYDELTGKVILKVLNLAESIDIINTASLTGDYVKHPTYISVNVTQDEIAQIPQKIFGSFYNKLITMLDLSSCPITTISSKLFNNSTEYGTIENIVLPSGLIEIQNEAFMNSGIHKLTIPSSVNKIASNGVKFTDYSGNYLYFEDQSQPWRCVASRNLFIPSSDGDANYKIFTGDGDSTIGGSSWNKCESATKVSDDISKISATGTHDYYVYVEQPSDYELLKTSINALTQGNIRLYITTKDHTIPDNAFQGFGTNLYEIVLASDIVSIGKNAFANPNINRVRFDKKVAWTCSNSTTFVPSDPSTDAQTLKGATDLSYTQIDNVSTVVTALTTATGNQSYVVNATNDDILQLGEAIRAYTGGDIAIDLAFSKNLTKIPANAFDGCTSLSEIKLPSTIDYIDLDAFTGCTGLNSALFDGESTWLISSEAIPKYTTQTCYAYTVSGDGTNNAINLTEKSAMYWMKVVTKETLKDYLKNFDTSNATEGSLYYFASYGSLKKLGDELRTVGNTLKDENGNVKDFAINLHLFMEEGYGLIDSEFSQLYLNGNYDESNASGTKCLKSFELLPCTRDDGSNYRRLINSGAFTNCDNLVAVKYPSNTEFYGGAFASCDNLNTINDVPLTNGCVIFEKTETSGTPETTITYKVLNSFTNDSHIKDLVLPSDIKYIESYAFRECTNLTQVTIPESVEIINDYAFSRADNISNVVLPESSEWLLEKTGETVTNLSATDVANKLKDIYYEYPSVSGDGSTRWLKQINK